MSTPNAPVANWAEIADKQEQIIMKMNDIGITPVSDNSTNSPPAGDEPKPASAASQSQEEEITAAERSLLQKVIRNGLVSNKNDIEIMQKDPTSPLYSVKSFEALNLKPNILKGVYDMGFNAPSKIQETALPVLLVDPPQNLIAQSQSGTGKTAAFVLAMLSRVDPTRNYPHVLCLSPTFELAIQTGKVAERMAKFSPEIKFRYAVRGDEVPRGTKLTEHIIIGTPGKVLDWALKLRFFDLGKVNVFVLDEADVMIATQGHQDQSFRIHRQLPPNCQMMFFSATYDQDVMDFAERIVKNAVVMRLKREEESLDNIKQYYVMCQTHEDKYQAISNIYGTVTIGQAMIFCQTRKAAQWLAAKMTKDGHAVALLSGDMTADQRISVLNRFREGKEKVLITTNVLARGIDVEQVTIVVNYDLPVDLNRRADCETYLHRIGRTGRFGKSGLTINLVDGPESVAVLKDIENHFGRKNMKLDCENVDEIEKLAQDG